VDREGRKGGERKGGGKRKKKRGRGRGNDFVAY